MDRSQIQMVIEEDREGLLDEGFFVEAFLVQWSDGTKGFPALRAEADETGTIRRCIVRRAPGDLK